MIDREMQTSEKKTTERMCTICHKGDEYDCGRHQTHCEWTWRHLELLLWKSDSNRDMIDDGGDDNDVDTK
uniref:Uncharacterized protein n=1 Tax=Arion vulgaris TaxID=1028688 RepID=A0A0B6Z791_9EUPU